MKTLKSICFVFVVLAIILFICGCDPTPEQLTEGKNFDPQTVSGVVTAKRTAEFLGDNPETKNIKGQTYYILDIVILLSPASGQGQNTRTYYGVSKEIFDMLEVGVNLPLKTLLTPELLSLKRGVILDLKACPETNSYYVVVDNYEEIIVYQVTPRIFYYKLHIGQKLPIELTTEELKLPTEAYPTGMPLGDVKK